MKEIIVTTILALCLVSLAGAEGKEEVREEPILLWQKTYEGVIDFSMTDDGNLIFLNETKKTGDECITTRHLVDSTGMVIRYSEGARAIITSDGNMIINLFDGVVENLKGEVLAKVPFSLSSIEIPVFSPHEKYVVIIPGYEANYPFLRVYEVRNGQQIWQMPIEKVTDVARFIILASFVTDESLAVFFDDKISLYDAKTGKQYWQRSISDLRGVIPNSVDFGFNELVTANSGDIAFFYRQAKFPKKPKDSLILTGKVISMDVNGDIRWKINDIHTRVIKLSPKGNYLLIEKLSTTDKLMLWDNRKGGHIWSKDMITPANEPYIFTNNEKYVLIPGYSYTDETQDPIMEKNLNTPYANLYLFETKTGKNIWKYPLNSCCASRIFLDISRENSRLLVADGKTIYFFDISFLGGEEK